MLCSISTGKSSSNWLDRLRSSKGFPTADNLDLDHFLANPNRSDSPITNASNSPNSISESTHSKEKQLQHRKPPPAEVISSEPAGDKEWFGVMSNVLSELFNIGEQAQTSRISRKKTSRKQKNPRICIIKTPTVNSSEEQKNTSDSVREDENIPPSTASLNSREEATRESKEDDDNNNAEEDEEEEEKEKGERELLGYSRSEVTVIDTSCEVWKVDKFIFRRKNIWKVKDKKGKSRTVGRKKRKPPPPPPPPPPSDDNNVGVCNKKRKVSSSELWSLKETSGRERGSPKNHGRNAPSEKGEEVSDEAPDDLTQVLRKRFPQKPGKGSASVILIKAIPTGKKNGEKLAKNGLKDTGMQYMA